MRHRGDIGGWGVAISCESAWCIIVQKFFLCLYLYNYCITSNINSQQVLIGEQRKGGALTKKHDTKETRIPGTWAMAEATRAEEIRNSWGDVFNFSYYFDKLLIWNEKGPA